MFGRDLFCNSSKALGPDHICRRGSCSYFWKRVKGHLKLIAWTLLLVSVLSGTTTKIVLGKERVCSTKIIVGQKHINHLKSLTECDVIEGSLTIAYVDFNRHSPEPSPLREITGFLAVYRVTNLQSLEELFPNLTLIRGLELFGNFSLVLHENIELQQIALVSLVKILRGSVRITRNPLLCYVHTIDWTRILEDIKSQYYVIKYNRNQNHCPACPTRTTYCWGYNKPQRICPDACENSECDATGQCSKTNCLLSYSHTTHNNCDVCKYFKPDHTLLPSMPCVKECDTNSVIIGERYCITSLKCREQGYFTFKKSCVKSCPDGSAPLGGNCEELGGTCLKCKGGIIRTSRDARRFANCAYIEGFLELQLIEKETNLIDELEKGLSNVVKISEFLRVWTSPQLTSLSFLKNLKTIEGKKLIWDKYSVVISQNFHLDLIWSKNQVVHVLNGLIYVHFNPHLCYEKIEDFTKVARGDSSSTFNDSISPYTNGRMAVCGPNVTGLNVKIEAYNATAARTFIKIDPRMFEDRRIFLGYLYYYIEVPEGSISIPNGRHGCGYDSWKSDLDLSKNARHILKNLTPFTRYALFVKTFAVPTSLYPKEGHSKIIYFKTLSSKPGPVPKFFVEPNYETEINLHWWPPSQPNGNISFYLIEAIKISPEVEIPIKSNTTETDTNGPQYENVATEVHNRKLADTRLNLTLNCVCASTSKWRGYPPNHNEFYDETEALFEDELANHIYVSETDRNDSKSNFPHNETEWDRLLEQQALEMVKEYDTGPKNFPIITPERRKDINLSDTAHRVFGDKHHYQLKKLLPLTRYRITITACNEPDLCGPKTAFNLTTSRYSS